MSHHRVANLALCLPALAALLFYLPTMGNAFVWDDKDLLYNQPFLRDPSAWQTALVHFLSIISPNYFRPLAVATFLIETRLWGVNPAGFHLTNVLLHALNTLLVTLLARELFRLASAAAPGRPNHPIAQSPSDPIAQLPNHLIVGFLYALHPALVESVSFTASRFDLLMTTWLLLALLADVRLRDHARWRWSAVGVLFLAATLTKETAVVFPVVLVLWHVASVPAASFRAKREIPAIVTLGFVGLGYLALRWLALGYLYRPNPPSAIPTGDLVQRVLLIARSAVEYAAVVVFPFTTLTPLHVTALPVPRDDPVGWSSVILLLLLIAGLLVLFRRLPRIVALVCAGSAALLPALNILPLELNGGAFAAERYLTFPLALFALAAGAVLLRNPARTRVLYGAAAVWLIACGVTVGVTLPPWRDDYGLWTWAAERAPHSALPHVNLSNYYIDQGDDARVLAEADAALQRDPSNAMAWNNRGVALYNTQQYAAAQGAWEQAARLEATNALFWSNLANALRAQGRLADSERVLIDQALRLNPNLALAHFSLGVLYLNLDRPDLASAPLERALVLLPPSRQPAARDALAQTREPERWLRLGNLLLHRGDIPSAQAAYARANALGAAAADVAVSQSATLIELKAWGDAEAVLTGALKQAPGDARLYNNLGVVAQARGDLNTAREYYARASALAPNWELPKQNLGALGK